MLGRAGCSAVRGEILGRQTDRIPAARPPSEQGSHSKITQAFLWRFHVENQSLENEQLNFGKI